MARCGSQETRESVRETLEAICEAWRPINIGARRTRWNFAWESRRNREWRPRSGSAQGAR